MEFVVMFGGKEGMWSKKVSSPGRVAEARLLAGLWREKRVVGQVGAGKAI